ncbi:hypothetical protein [Streptomyces anulatus]|uniref:hypothetical protein n=1 Tax=Streptomyces anulatus TaxID=1892 RepID=UPI001C2719F8|nr:hypothetical protein [Streptomyces anulatus]
MHDSPTAPGTGHTTERWHRIEALPQQEAEELARTAQITRHALREYMVTHIVSEATADAEVRQLVERFLQVGRLSRSATGTVRARSPRADGGEHPYSFLLDLETGHVIGYNGPGTSWFDDVRVPLDDLRRRLADRRHREQEQQQRRAAHEQRMRMQQEAAAARRAAAPEPTWPVLPAGYYTREGDPAPAPAHRRPITDEARIRQVGRLPHVVFHSDALNSPFFREVPVERRCEALQRVLNLLLRAPSKGTLAIGADAITVTGKKVTMTLTPDCAAVRTLNPPRPGPGQPSQYRAKNWTKGRERSREQEPEQ